MNLVAPIPFAEALARHDVRQVMPTHLSSRQLQEIDRGITKTSLFSARNLMQGYLEALKEKLRLLISPAQVSRPDRATAGNPDGLTTDGRNDADLRVELRQVLKEHGYAPAPEDRGTIKDFASDQRLNLVVRTNVEIAQNYGYWQQGQDPLVLDAFPAQELYRAGDPVGKVRDWPKRWRAAAAAAGDEDALRVQDESGRMIARKDSPIWQSLGDGDGLDPDEASDALHNPYPPFAFNSLMDIRDIGRDQALALGLIRADEQVQPSHEEFPVPNPAEAA